MAGSPGGQAAGEGRGVTYLFAFGFPAVFAVVGWLALGSLDRWIDDALAEYRRWRDYGCGEPLAGSVEATVDEIRALPETGDTR